MVAEENTGTDRVRRTHRPAARPARLDVPKLRRHSLADLRPDPEFVGRFSERFARFMGTAKFIGYMTVIVIVWLAINITGIYGFKWDPYPFILLNLFFSTQASYAAPLILLAQNRQEARDRVQYDSDRDVQLRTRADMEFLAREVASLRMSVGEVATRDFLRSELRSMLAELDARHDEVPVRPDGAASPR